MTSTSYSPARLDPDGFVHCAGSPAVALAVAADYFSDLEQTLYVLVIDPTRLTAPLHFEAPAPIPGGGRDHLDEATTFPHVYGPIDRAAIVEGGVLRKRGGSYNWPERVCDLEELLEAAGGT